MSVTSDHVEETVTAYWARRSGPTPELVDPFLLETMTLMNGASS